MRLFNCLNRLQCASLFAFILASVLIVLSEIFQLIGANIHVQGFNLLSSFSAFCYELLGYVFCYFITLALTKEKQAFKAFWSILCLAVINTALYSFYGESSVYFTGIAVAVFCAFCFNRFDRILALSVTLIFSILFGVLLGFIMDYWNHFMMWASQVISGKSYFSPVLFSIFDNLLSLFGIDTLKEMFFSKSYGGSMVYSGEIVTGAKDLFSHGYNGELVSGYLSGHYLLLFAVFGISISMLRDLKGTQRYVLIAVAAGAVLSGNASLLFLFFLLESPFVFISVLFIGALAYLTAYILDLGMGYLFNGGIVEMVIYFDHAVYFFAGGVVFFAIGYFVYKYCYERYGITDRLNVYIPTRLNDFVKALGGISNIIRFKDDKLEVRNPKLINTMCIECEINENIISSDDERMGELKEYLV